jgi:hypothetical protein
MMIEELLKKSLVLSIFELAFFPIHFNIKLPFAEFLHSLCFNEYLHQRTCRLAVNGLKRHQTLMIGTQMDIYLPLVIFLGDSFP